MEIGRKIYYDKLTGNTLQDCGERQGDVIETTLEQDFMSYVSLSERVPETVGVIQLDYGQYADKFSVYYYHIDPVTNEIVWGELINLDVPTPTPDPMILLTEKINKIAEDIGVVKSGVTELKNKTSVVGDNVITIKDKVMDV